MADQATASPALPFGLGALSQLNARQKLTAMAMLAFAIALLVGAWLWTKEPPYGVLFSNLSDQDGGQIVAALQQQNVPYKYSEGGGAILVPVSQVHDARLKLASQGLPKGGLVGFELMENQKLGTSQFAEQVNYQRGLEGELARSIQTLGAVRAARVHLAIPKQTAFLRDDLKPSASVLVSLQPGRTLDPPQIAGIVHLVSSSVPQLAPGNVSVIDQDGKLVSQGQGSQKNESLNPGQLGYIKDIEAQYVRRVETILEPLLGKGNFRTQVTADVDFNQIDQVEESYLPNPVPDTAIRSQQTAETGAGSPPAIGVPGALTNQAPVPATAPITNPQVGGAAGGANTNGNYTRNATINYELDKTVRHTRGTPGGVKRLSVAVAVNHKRPLGNDGKPGKAVPPTAEELKRVNDLVRESVGFNEKRGDSINVAAASFVQSEAEAIPDTPLWKDASVIAFAKEAAQYLIFAIIAWLVWTKLLKPVFEMFAAAAQRAEAERKAAAEAAGVSEIAHAGGAHHGRSFDDKLKSARDTAQQEPKLIADLIKEWMGANGT
ncbi:MAG: flagellar basal-body MS-ring/collar protein FliF [Pseudomonadota bacterium]